MGYGMMWGISSTFPAFFPKQEYGLMQAVFTGLGAFGTLIVTLIISLCAMSDIQIFEVLLILSITVLVTSALSFYYRYISELKEYMVNKYRIEAHLLPFTTANLKLATASTATASSNSNTIKSKYARL